MLKKLLARRDKFDAILIETTGMADPGPVSFYTRESVRSLKGLPAFSSKPARVARADHGGAAPIIIIIIGPKVIQTFYMSDEIKAKMKLDGIITVRPMLLLSTH